MQRFTFSHQTTIGTIWIVEEDGQLIELTLSDDNPNTDLSVLETPLMVAAFKQLDEYFSGVRTVFELPLAPKGTAFQKKVWAFMQTIPYGATRSYKETAIAVGSAAASRAVGSACGKNPLPLFIPCHRIVASGGKWGGFSLGGVEVKKRLLKHENSSCPLD